MTVPLSQPLVRPSRPGLLLVGLLCCGLAAASVFLWLAVESPVLDADRWLFLVLETAVIVSFLIPVALRIRRGRFDPFEPPILFGVFYFLTFGINGLWLVLPNVTLRNMLLLGDFYYLNKSLVLYLLGWLLLWAGYRSRFARAIVGKWQFLSRPVPHVPQQSLVRWGLIFYAVGIVVRLMLIRLGLYGALKAQNWDVYDQYVAYLQIFKYLEGFAAYGIILLMLALLMQRKRALGVALLIVVAIELTFAFISSYRTPIVQLFLLVTVILFYYARQGIPWRWFIVGAFVLVLADPFLSAYRLDLVEGNVSAQAGANPLQGLGDVLTRVSSGSSVAEVGNSGLQGLSTRASYLVDMGMGVWYRDHYGPLEDPLSFLLRAPSVFIPRLLWSAKPVGNLGYLFYVIVEGGDTTTSGGPMLPGWLYLEWGIIGLGLYFFCFGIMQYVFYAMYKQTSDVSRLLFVPTLVWILSHYDMQEPLGWLQPLVYQLLILAVVRRFLFRPAREAQPATAISRVPQPVGLAARNHV
ncbi:MAG: hypothetical protein HY259_04425 [Chloroflexi bacterium]|nr:hypothetical protein [Chloroflexota bacterium]MBI3732689.1 hypothetical protein [Chloroflexota bacterium]